MQSEGSLLPTALTYFPAAQSMQPKAHCCYRTDILLQHNRCSPQAHCCLSHRHTSLQHSMQSEDSLLPVASTYFPAAQSMQSKAHHCLPHRHTSQQHNRCTSCCLRQDHTCLPHNRCTSCCLRRDHTCLPHNRCTSCCLRRDHTCLPHSSRNHLPGAGTARQGTAAEEEGEEGAEEAVAAKRNRFLTASVLLDMRRKSSPPQFRFARDRSGSTSHHPMCNTRSHRRSHHRHKRYQDPSKSSNSTNHMSPRSTCRSQPAAVSYLASADTRAQLCRKARI